MAQRVVRGDWVVKEMGRLAGRVALITGAARGMGKAMALAFAREGASAVVINFRSSQADAISTVRELEGLGCKSMAVRGDVSRPDDVRAMFEQVALVHPRLDILVNNAGLLIRASIRDLTSDQWDESMGANLKSMYLCTQAALPLLDASSSAVVLNVASGGAGMHGQGPRLAHYYAAKGGVVTLSRCLATELAPIRVNCLAPGFIATGFGGTQPGTHDKVVSMTPLGRVGRADDVAQGAVFLASDDASFITGHVLTVDGGRTM